jgi:hypothetical protein
MLMIGSADRNAGKTTFACSVIEKFSSRHGLVAIKVTAVDAAHSGCPRGGDGCGVCSSLDGPYDIIEETDPTLEKDTSKMLAAGAKRVFWLKVLKSHLAEGIGALMEIADPQTPSVCESNTLRQVVQPGLFFMLKNSSCEKYKASAKKVAHLADRTVNFDGQKFDFSPDHIKLINGSWTGPLNAK